MALCPRLPFWFPNVDVTDPWETYQAHYEMWLVVSGANKFPSLEYIRQHVSRKKPSFARTPTISSWKYSAPSGVKAVLKLFRPLTYGYYGNCCRWWCSLLCVLRAHWCRFIILHIYRYIHTYSEQRWKRSVLYVCNVCYIHDIDSKY